MALNLNSGAMNSTINSGIHVRQFDPKLYQRMADRMKATFVNFLRLLGMKRKAKNMGSKRGFVVGDNLKNVKNVKYEWQDIYTGTPLSSISSYDTSDSKTAATTDKIVVPHGVGDKDAIMFHVNDIILDRDKGEKMLITNVDSANGVLTVVRGLGTANQGISGETIAASDVLVLISSAFAEGSYSADPRSYNPTQDWNYCQIFKRSVENTGTNEEIDSYGSLNKLQIQKQMELEQFMIERERAYLMGVRAEFDAPSGIRGGKIRTTAGLDYFLRNNVSTFASFTYNNFIDFCEAAYEYGGGEKILLVNDKLMTMIQKEVINKSNSIVTCDVSPNTKEYGFSFSRLKTHKGSMDLLVDSTMNDLYANATGFALETELLDEAILRPDVWRENVQTPDYDGRKDEIIGECGFKLVSPDRHRKLVITG